jgi:hypothetical protein
MGMTRFGKWNLRNSIFMATGAIAFSFASLQVPAQAQSSESHATSPSIPNLSGLYRHNVSIYSAPARGGVGPVGDMPGYEHEGADPWVGDHTNPLLQPHTAAEVERLSQLELAGGVNLTSYQLCQLLGVPLILTQRENVQILQEKDVVTIIHQRDQQVRHIYMNVAHSDLVKPTWYGESVGHYEGDTLVVDTIGQTDKTRVDRYGSFSTEEVHVIERFHINGEGALQVDFTVTDPNTFTQPWNATQYYRPSETPWEQIVCAENNRDAQTGVDYVGMPVDNTPDF